ncbi:hypothetical protein [Ensifer aridi]|uniref:hypothetical protein n=1 Tax=Ensifer aridi TaxID=1708715 RepID=UPI000A0F7258|nr:hypothetical protein [Ensifer aridi]
MGPDSVIGGIQLGLDIFDRVREKLLKQPDPAAEHLVAVFDQLRAMHSSLDTELSLLVGMMFWEGMDRRDYAQSYEKLSHLSTKSLQARFEEARAHCKMIDNIYQRFLKRWFEKYLNPEEQCALEDLFRTIHGADEDFVRALDNAAIWIGHEARELRHILEDERYDTLQSRQRKTRASADKMRDSVAEQWRQLARLRTEFVEQTRAVI